MLQSLPSVWAVALSLRSALLRATYVALVLLLGNATALAQSSFPDEIANSATVVPPANTPNVGTACRDKGGEFDDGSGSCTASDVDALVYPRLTVVKTGAPDSVSRVGDEIKYTITVANSGNVSLSNVELAETLTNGVGTGLTLTTGPTGPSGDDAILDVGETWTYTASYRVTQADLDAGGFITNTVSVVATLPDGTLMAPMTSTVSTAVVHPSFTVAKTGAPDSVSAVDEVISYTITVANTGDVSLSNVVLTETLTNGVDPGLTLDGPPTRTASSINDDEVLDVGESWEFTASYTVTQADLDAGGPITNTVSVVATPPSGAQTGPVEDTVTVEVVQIRVDKTLTEGSPSLVTEAGQELEYEIAVANAGSVALSNVRVTDTLNETDLELTPVSGDGNGVLDVGETWVFTASYTVTQADLDAGADLKNAATATATAPLGGEVTSLPSSVAVGVDQDPDFTVTKMLTEGSPNPVTEAGQVLAYRVEVTNAGNVTLRDVRATDTLSNGTELMLVLDSDSDGDVVGVLDVGETWVFTASYAVTQADLDAGVALVNAATAKATAPTPLGDVVLERTSDPVTVEVVQIRVDKTGAPDSVSAVDEVISYTITVANTGSVALSNVLLTDRLTNGEGTELALTSGPTGPSGDDAILDVGETWTYTASYRVTQADLDAGGVITNTISVTAALPDGTRTAPMTWTATTVVEQLPSFTVAKTGAPASVSAVDEVIAYTITVANAGNVSLSNVVPTDQLSNGAELMLTLTTGDTDGDGVLDVGETWVFTASYTVTQADLDAGVALVNKATVTATTQSGGTVTPPPLPSSVTTAIVQSPAFTVKKTLTAGQNPVTAAGQVLVYRVEVANAGNVTLREVTVTDTLNGVPLALTPVSGDVNGDLNVGETWVFTAIYTVTQADIDAGADLKNAATATATAPLGGAVTSLPSSVPVGVDQDPAFTVTKTQTAGPNPVRAVGDVPTYTIVVQNTGTVSLSSVTLADTLKNGIDEGLRLTEGPTRTASSINDDDVLDVGETWTYTASYTVTQADLDAGGPIVNTVSVVATLPGGTRTEPVTSTESTTVVQAPAFEVVKSGGLATVTAAGQVLTYEVTVANTGNVSLVNVMLTDRLSNGIDEDLTLDGPPTRTASSINGDDVLDVRETWTYTASYAVTQADLDAGGPIVNTISVTATLPGGTQTEPAEDTVTTAVVQSPLFTVDKTGGDDPVSAVDDVIDYTITVANKGNVSLSDVVLTDRLSNGIDEGLRLTEGPTLTSGDDSNNVLEVGETWTYTARYAVTQADLDAGGPIVNTVSVVATLPGGTRTEPVTSTESTTVVQAPAFEVAKTLTDGSPDPVTEAGQVLTYEVRVTNIGTVALFNVAAADRLNGTELELTLDSDTGTGVLDLGETWLFRATYTVTQADLDAGVALVNEATATATTQSGGAVTPPPSSSVIVGVDQAPSFTVTKTLTENSPDPVTAAGQVLEYEVRVTNTGNVALFDVVATDRLSNGAKLMLALTTGDADGDGVLDVDETWIYTAGYTVTQDDLNAGVALVNMATVTATSPSDALLEETSSSVTVEVEQIVAGTLSKVADPTVADTAGQVINYTIELTNTGNVDGEEVTMSDVLVRFGDAGGVTSDPLPVTLVFAGNGDSIIDVGETWVFTVSYTVTQADIDNAVEIHNEVTGSFTGINGDLYSEYARAVTIVAQPSLEVAKVLTSGQAAVTAGGDVLEYEIAVANDSIVSLTNIVLTDTVTNGAGTVLTLTTGPTLDRGDTNGNLVLDPGETWVYVATYVATQADLDAGGDIANAVSVTSNTPGGGVVAGEDEATVPVVAEGPGLKISKTASVRLAYRGGTISYAITVANLAPSSSGPLTIVDTLPAGFLYVPDSALLEGAPVVPAEAGRTLTFDDIVIPGNGEVELTMQVRLSMTVEPGDHINTATLIDPATGTPMAPPATATVRVPVEHAFDCGEIIGKVFDDLDRNGYQDEGEPGLPGVRVVTVGGVLITTDRYGRFSVPCAGTPQADIGSNFIMKVDTGTLPTGYRMTTENPRTVRLTRGKVTELNFGAAIDRVIRFDLNAAAFVNGSTEPNQELRQAVDALLPVLEEEHTALRFTYYIAGEHADLAEDRLQALSEVVQDRWGAFGGSYDLSIETKVLSVP